MSGRIDVLYCALRAIDSAPAQVQNCEGNCEGLHVCDISMDTVFATLMKTRARHILSETSKSCHGHEWSGFRDRGSDGPDDKVLVPSVVYTTTNLGEHPERIAQRLERFVYIAGTDRLIAGSDCGFGAFAGFGAVDPGIAYVNLSVLAEGVALASQWA